MIAAAIPKNETERLRALHNYQILDTIQEESFDSLVQLASQICNTSISLISLIDSDRQWFKARVGLDAQQTSREIAFCSHAILGTDTFIVPDASKDDRFSNNPLVLQHPEIRFYAGVPLTTPDGYNIGTLCVIDSQPKSLNDLQLFALKTISRQVIAQLELRQNIKSMNEMNTILRNQTIELNRMNTISLRLISVLAHDLRSPLSTFKSYADMFVDGDLTESEKVKYAADLSQTLNKTIEMVDNVLKWGTDQMHGDLVSMDSIQISAVAAKQIEAMKLLFHSKQNRILNQIDPELLVRAEENMLQFIIRNLLQNANKFTSDGNITIRSAVKDGMAEIYVTDTGVGINPNILEHIFNWNFTKSSVGTSGEKGTGLGLKLCKEFVNKLGGVIRVESEMGKGTSFIFSVPVFAKA